MMVLEAPYETPITATIFPNPELSNVEALDLDVDYNLSMDGTRYSYVKSSDRKRLTFEFVNQGKGKMIEFQEFIKAFAGRYWKLTDFNGDIWRVILDNVPFEITTNQRNAHCGGVRTEGGLFRLEFIGEQVG